MEQPLHKLPDRPSENAFRIAALRYYLGYPKYLERGRLFGHRASVLMAATSGGALEELLQRDQFIDENRQRQREADYAIITLEREREGLAANENLWQFVHRRLGL